MFGVTQLKITIGANDITDTNGKYLIIMNTSSVDESFFTVMYAKEVDIAPRNAITKVKLLISMFKFDN